MFWTIFYPLGIVSGQVSATHFGGWAGYELFMWMMLPLHFIITSQMKLDFQTAHEWKAEDTAPFIWLAAYLMGTGLVWDVVGESLAASTLGTVLKWMLVIYAGLAGLIGCGALLGATALALKKAAPDSALTSKVVAGIEKHAVMPTGELETDWEPAELKYLS